MLAAPGLDLLDWLARFTLPEEARYGDLAWAAARAGAFLKTLFRHGTTSALVFSSVHKCAAEALFAAAEKEGMALTTGKTMMDRNARPDVEDDAETSGIEFGRADPGLARSRTPAVRHHPALCRHLNGCPTRRGGRSGQGSSLARHADASF